MGACGSRESGGGAGPPPERAPSKQTSGKEGSAKARKRSKASVHSLESSIAGEAKFTKGNFIFDQVGRIEDFYNITVPDIGKGEFSQVHLAENKQSGKQRALKQVLKPSGNKEIQAIKLEVALMKNLDHPNIVKLFESFEDARYLFIVLESCNGGVLRKRVMKDPEFTEEWQAAFLFKQMVATTWYLHKKGIAHCNLTLDNFLVMDNALPVGEVTIKLFDFGSAHAFTAGGGGFITGKPSGSPFHHSPQMIKGKWTEKADMWSLGVALVQMLTGDVPFQGANQREVYKKITDEDYSFAGKEWNGISKDGQDLVYMLLMKHEAARIDAGEAISHNWVRKARGVSGSLPKDLGSRLREYKEMSDLKKAALSVIANSLGDDDIKELKEAFHTIDANGDGTLTFEELQVAFDDGGAGPNMSDSAKAALKSVMDSMDTDGSGKIDYTEFLAATMDSKLYTREDALWEAFCKFDRIGNGVITKQELEKVLGEGAVEGMAGMDIDALMAEADTNGDGVIDFNEFKDLMRKKAHS